MAREPTCPFQNLSKTTSQLLLKKHLFFQLYSLSFLHVLVLGPIAPPGAGVLAIKSVAGNTVCTGNSVSRFYVKDIPKRS